MTERILLEIACGDIRDAIAAERAGADRLELCSAMELDGLTPSLGTALEVERRMAIPFIAMIRPRAGNFAFGPAEIAVMVRDTELLLDAGAAGIVVGCLTSGGTIDVPACEQLVAAAGGAEKVFHRAFDQLNDQLGALDLLVDLGFTRVLTSGGARNALEGAKKIRALVERAAGRIEILPGGGIREDNVEAVVRQTGCGQVHLSRR